MSHGSRNFVKTLRDSLLEHLGTKNNLHSSSSTASSSASPENKFPVTMASEKPFLEWRVASFVNAGSNLPLMAPKTMILDAIFIGKST